MYLTLVAIRNAKVRSKPYKLYDKGGLYLLIQLDDARYWRLKYRFAGKENHGADHSSRQGNDCA